MDLVGFLSWTNSYCKKKRQWEKQRCVYTDYVFDVKDIYVNLKPFFKYKRGIENYSQEMYSITIYGKVDFLVFFTQAKN